LPPGYHGCTLAPSRAGGGNEIALKVLLATVAAALALAAAAQSASAEGIGIWRGAPSLLSLATRVGYFTQPSADRFDVYGYRPPRLGGAKGLVPALVGHMVLPRDAEGELAEPWIVYRGKALVGYVKRDPSSTGSYRFFVYAAGDQVHPIGYAEQPHGSSRISICRGRSRVGTSVNTGGRVAAVAGAGLLLVFGSTTPRFPLCLDFPSVSAT